MDLTQMRAAVRRDLKDEDPADYRWTNDELDRHIGRAVVEFSEHLPDEKKTAVATVDGSREMDISELTGRIMIEAVEYPAGLFPPRWQRFSLWGDMLTLLGDDVPDGSDAFVYHGDLHVLDAEGSTIPSRYEDLVAMGAAGYAAVAGSAHAVNRVNAGGTGTAEDYLAWGRERLAEFRKELRRLGRRGRVRTGTLYTPWSVAARCVEEP